MTVLCSLLLSVLRCCDWGKYGSVGKLQAQLFEVTGSKLSPAATHLALDQEAGARIPSILPLAMSCYFCLAWDVPLLFSKGDCEAWDMSFQSSKEQCSW